MKTQMKKIPVIMLCFIMLTGTTAFTQQGSDKSKSNIKKEKKQDAPSKVQKDTDDTESEVIKKANDLDIEEAEKDKTKTVDKELPDRTSKIKAAKDADEDEEVGEDGNAYGKNKGDLKGKEFGQTRAEQAKLNHQEKSQELNESLNQGDEKIKEARTKIEEAKVKLESDKKAKRISEIEYKQKKEKIAKAEEAVGILEHKVNEAKQFEKSETAIAVDSDE